MDLEVFASGDAAQVADAAAIWNAACPPDLALSERLVHYNAAPAANMLVAGCFVTENGRRAGFVQASCLPDRPDVSAPEAGWVDAIAVRPEDQRRGIGNRLLEWAEGWLVEHGCKRTNLGASLHPYAPGLPAALPTLPFFTARGYAADATRGRTFDVAHDLARYSTPPSAERAAGKVRSAAARVGEENDLLGFLRREFPNRWRYECEDWLAKGGRVSDYTLLWSERGVDGFCRLTFEDSLQPLGRFYMHRLPRPWGQLGPIGVSADRRGVGYGAVILDAGLRRLQDSGVRGCVIDWTGLLDFYGKFGFTPYREYIYLRKVINE